MKKISTNQSQLKASILTVKPEDCTLCYACVRVCPARAIEIQSNANAVRIIPERCTACGSCYEVCPTEAIYFDSELDRVEFFLNTETISVALVDPSISAEFPDITDYRHFIGMIKALGFDYVNDISFGVDLIAREYAKTFGEFKGKYFISSKCPAVVYQITKYYSNLTDNMVPILSPVAATAAVARKKYGQGINVVAISPCLASKLEQRDQVNESKIDAHITFSELRKLFNRREITENLVEFEEFDSPVGRKGSLFPLTSGLMQASGQKEDLLSSNFHSSSGRNNMLDAIDEFALTNEIRKHLDLFYCEGCIMGPGMSPGGRKYMRQTLVKEYTHKRLGVTDEKQWLKDLESFSDIDLSRTFKPDNQRFPAPPEKKIKETLEIIGKQDTDLVDRGCAACGYKTCTDFAIAVAHGLAKVDMCHSYGSQNRQEYIQSLQTTNKQLAETKQALEKSEKAAKEEKQTVQDFSDTISAVMQKIPSGVVIVDAQLKVIQANQVLIDILGEEAQRIHEIIPGLQGAEIKSLLTANIF
ncbi:MAG: 4Fe-4S binding protein, partial [Bacteroidales bacterium]|nr:4Fe-4S binding protein [Bacteroidales bacterium]